MKDKVIMMKPHKVSDALRRIATKIDQSKTPSKNLVISDIKRVLIAVDDTDSDYEFVYMSISIPRGMNADEAIQRAKALLPCKTGEFELNQSDEEWIAGSMQCEIGYYENNPDGAEYGPDKKGVTVNWETP